MIGAPPPRGGRQRPRHSNAGPVQCRNDIRPEEPRPDVEVIQGNPGDRPGVRRRPQRHGHRLARARRAGDSGQRAPPCTLGDQLGDPRALNGPVRRIRRGDLRCQDRGISGNRRPSGAGRPVWQHRPPSVRAPLPPRRESLAAPATAAGRPAAARTGCP